MPMHQSSHPRQAAAPQAPSARTAVQASAAALLAALLAACGGGGGQPPFEISGIAATGHPVAGQAVTIRCALGDAVSVTTDANGAFNRTLTAQIPPCLLETDGPTGKLHGYSAGAGRANLTPLTSLILARALKAAPASVFGAPSAANWAAIKDNLAAANTAVTAEATRLMGWTPKGDPMTMSLAVGDDEDRALENLSTSITLAGSTLSALATSAASGTALLAALPAEEARGQDAKTFTVNANDSAATTFAALVSASGDAVDVTTTQRFAGKLASYDNNPKSPFAAYRIEVPPNWNGELVMYAHGYAGEGAALSGTTSSIRRYLINNGYAWAASGYSKNSYDVRSGVEDTNKLALAFASITGKAAPTRTYIFGHSMGGHIAAAAIEEEALATAQNKVRYAGSVPMCGVVGDAELFNGFAAQGLAALQLSGVGAALPGSLTQRQRYQALLPVSVNPSSVVGTVHQALFDNFPNTGFTPKGAAGAQYFSALRNITGGNRPLFDVGLSYGGSYASAVSSFGTDGSLTGILTKYSLDTSKVVFAVDGDAAASATLNAMARLTPDANANALRRDGMRWVPQVNGRPYAPVLTIHTLGDLFVPFRMEQVYKQRLNAAGAPWSDRVVQRAIRGAAHCDFTNAEIQAAFEDMVKWVKQGTKPAGDDVLTPATVAAASYGCTHTKNVFHPVDEATSPVRTLRGVIGQLAPACPAS